MDGTAHIVWQKIFLILNLHKLTHLCSIYCLTRLHQGAFLPGRWRSLRKTSPSEDPFLKLLQRRVTTILLGPSCLGSSFLLSSAHLYSRSFEQQQAGGWHNFDPDKWLPVLVFFHVFS